MCLGSIDYQVRSLTEEKKSSFVEERTDGRARIALDRRDFITRYYFGSPGTVAGLFVGPDTLANATMQDMKASVKKLLAEAKFAAQIASSATGVKKRELYERLAEHFRRLAGEIEKVMADRRQ
jgi:hypothetical protein